MGKQHQTIQNEPQESPVPNQKTEIIQPNDPNIREIPRENDEPIPDELPPSKSPEEDPPIDPNKV